MNVGKFQIYQDLGNSAINSCMHKTPPENALELFYTLPSYCFLGSFGMPEGCSPVL